MSETRYVVMFSGGAGSWAAAKRTVKRHGADRVTLLFCDTKIERHAARDPVTPS